MRYEFETTGPVSLVARMRGSDLVVTASEAAPTLVVEVTPRRGGDDLAAATRVEMANGRLEIVVPKSIGGIFGGRGSVSITATVPVGSVIEVETGSGDLRTRGHLARANLKAGSGDLGIDDVEELRATCGSGAITVGSVAAGHMTSGSGDIRLGRARARTELRTGSGDVEVDDATDLAVTTGSGDVTVATASGELNLASGSGDLTVRSIVAGSVMAKAASGDVQVGIARGTAALLDCSSVAGSVSSDLEAGDEPGADENSAVLRIRTVSGAIRIRRA